MSMTRTRKNGFSRTLSGSITLIKLLLGLLIGLVVVGPWFGTQLVNQSRGVPAWHPMQDLYALLDSRASTLSLSSSQSQVIDNATVVGSENNTEKHESCSSLQTLSDHTDTDNETESCQEMDEKDEKLDEPSSNGLPVQCA